MYKRVKKYYNKSGNKLYEVLTDNPITNNRISNKVGSVIKTAALNTALEKFVKSNFLKETTTVIPLTLLTICTRGIVNFLITSHIQTGYYFIDFFLYLTVTIILAIYSPVLYNLYNHNLNMEHFSGTIIDSIWTEGFQFIELWKGRILGTLGVAVIILLFFVEINSTMIQEFIFHTLLSSVIVEYLTNLAHMDKKVDKKNDKKNDKKVANEVEEVADSPTVNRLSKSESNLPIIIEEYTSLSKSVPCFGQMEYFEPSSGSFSD